MFNVRLAGGHLYGKQLFTRLSLMVSLMASFVLSFFPLDVLDEIWDLIESVSEGFLTYSHIHIMLASFEVSGSSWTVFHRISLHVLFFFLSILSCFTVAFILIYNYSYSSILYCSVET